MKIRGQRECSECGTQWSYYETGSIACPECGSIRSVGLDDRTEHTDTPATLDLSAVRSMIDTEPVRQVAEAAVETTSEFVRKRGFIKAGEMQPLDATFVAAVELQYLGRHLARSIRVEDDEELYLLSVLRGADAGERPPPSEVPASLESPRGLAAAAVVNHYRRDLSRFLDDHPDEDARRLLGTLVEHKKRFEALDGAVGVSSAEALTQATVDLSHYVAFEDEPALTTARDRVESLDPE